MVSQNILYEVFQIVEEFIRTGISDVIGSQMDEDTFRPVFADKSVEFL